MCSRLEEFKEILFVKKQRILEILDLFLPCVSIFHPLFRPLHMSHILCLSKINVLHFHEHVSFFLTINTENKNENAHKDVVRL